MNLSERPLTFSERFLVLAHQEGYWHCSGCTTLRTPLPLETVLQAWKEVQERHSLLRVRIIAGGNAESFRLCPDSLHQPSVEEPPHDVDALLLEEGHQPLADPPYWRVRLLLAESSPDSSSHVAHFVHSIHHGIGDGVAHLRVIQEVLECCHALTSGESTPEEPSANLVLRAGSLPHLKSQHRAGPVALRDALRFAFQTWKQRPRVARAPGSQRERAAASRTHFVYRKMDPETSRSIYRATRRHRTTLHGALGAAGIQTLLNTFPEMTGATCSSCIDLRPCYDVDPAHQFFQSQGLVRHFRFVRSEDPDFWSLARECRQSLTRQMQLLPSLVALEPVFNAVLRRGNLRRQFAQAQRRLRRARGFPVLPGEGHLIFSSLGVHTLPLMEELRVMVTDNECGGLFTHYFHLNEGALELTITYPHPLVSSEDARRYADEMMLVLEKAAREEDC